MIFMEALEKLLGVEGGYSNHVDDPGGATQWGITEALAREYGYNGLMRELPLKDAADIYRLHFWMYLNCTAVGEVSETLQWDLFDFGVNAGRRRSAEYFQETLNVFNNRGQMWPDLTIDGIIGPKTLRALHAMKNQRGKLGLRVLERAFEDRHAEWYQYLARTNQRFESFIYGWYVHRIVGD